MSTQQVSQRQQRVIALLKEHFDLDAEGEPYHEHLTGLTVGMVDIDSTDTASYYASVELENNPRFWSIEVVYIDTMGMPYRYEMKGWNMSEAVVLVRQ